MSNDTPKDSNTEQYDESQSEELIFPIVGIGASAGGLDAFEKFFTNTPPDSGMAFVLVQHLDPNHDSMLVDLIRRYTRMEVHQVLDAMPVEPNTIYIIPPNKDLALLHNTLHLMDPEAPRGFRLPIDFFFRSLAEDLGDRAICIVLSGTGSDGTLGLKAIKEVGGLTIVQAPHTAKYDGMPVSAIATDMADFVLPPEHMPEQLTNYIRHATRLEREIRANNRTSDSEAIQKIFIVLRSRTGHDFSRYKKNTIIRRIERRMAVNLIDSLQDYLRYLRQNQLEVDTLFKDLLIGVTSFFRDDEAFDLLETEIIPQIFENKPPEEDIRVWVCGCSTGEEAYSLAILLREHAMRSGQKNRIQIFGTDIDSQSIEKARLGIYPDNIAADVTHERLQSFFEADGNSYQVSSHIRDMVIFATQNVIKDPPFSRLDLISCRNLLIYLNSELQRKVIPLFHYALNASGFLVLGTSESVGEHQYLFDTIDRKQKIYQKLSTLTPVDTSFDFTSRADHTFERFDALTPVNPRINMRDITQQILLDDHVPVAILVNERYEILYTHGRTGKYLEIVTGESTSNVLNLAREGLKIPLTTSIRKVIANSVPIVHNVLHVRTNGDTQPVKVTVKPVQKPASVQGLILILIEDILLDIDGDNEDNIETDPKPQPQRIVELEQELNSTRQYLQTTIEELETSNEELKSTNEELQSSNEELQSTNEELETTKEELQSINEELMTVNAELEGKIEELSRSNNDLNNLLASIGIAIIFINMELNVQRFNPSAADLVNLIDSDIGRPISHLVRNFQYDQFAANAEQVLNTLGAIEEEVQTHVGRWYTMRMRPYRTVDNLIAGVIVTFSEITPQKQVQEELAVLNNVVEEAFSVVIVTGADGNIEYVNPQYEKLLGYEKEDVIGKNFAFNAKPISTDDPLDAIFENLKEGTIWRGEIHMQTKDGDDVYFLTSIVPTKTPQMDEERYVFIYDDITDIELLQEELKQSELVYRTLARRLPDIAVLIFDHDLRYVVAEGASLEQAGYVRSEMEGRTFYEIVPKERQSVLEPLYLAALNGEEKRLEYTSLANRRFRLLAIPLDEEDNVQLGGMIVIHELDADDD